jgi:hypothetical protein
MTTTVTNSGLGAAAAPYAQDMLAKSYALTVGDPYHAYTGQTVAGPTGLQQTAADSISGLNAGNLASQGTALTTQGANYDPSTQQFDGAAAAQYMNPYQQNVTDIANQEAARSSNIQGTYDSSKAAAAGAFGGSRQGIVDAERNRNLAMLQNNNTMQGQAAGYANAQQQFNADQTRQQQDRQFGSQAALSGGNALTNQGMQAFTQQQVSGAQQQAAAQGDLTQAKENFTGAVQHPYDQLNFMANQIKAVPGSTTTQTSDASQIQNQAAIDAANSGVGQLGALAGGIGALGSLWGTGKSIASAFGFNKGGAVASGLPQARIAQLYGAM